MYNNSIVIEIPKYEDKIVLSSARRPKYKKDPKTGDKVLSNPRTVGKPKFWTVNGQSIYNGALHPKMRAKVMDKLKEYISKNIGTPVIPKSWQGQVKISLFICDIIPSGRYWDCDNKWPWLKAVSDCLVDKGCLEDDNILFVKSNGEITFIPVTKEEDRKLVIIISKLDLSNLPFTI